MNITIKDTRYAFTGTAQEILHQMRGSGWEPDADTEADYMQAVAQRVALWNGADIAADSPDTFLQSLADAALITIA